MKWREYYDKLRQWEAEGYDVSELKHKWFPEGSGRSRSRARMVLPVLVVALVVVGGLLVWQHISSGTPNDETVAMLSTSIVPSVGGSVSPSNGTYDLGQEVILTASPASGYRFSHWGGDVGGSENPITIDIREDVSVTANFARVSYSLSVSASPSGSGSVTPSSGTYDAGAVIDIVAEAEEGYRFSQWGGDVDTITNVNAASTTISMDGDYSITATFEERLPGQYDLTIDSNEGGSVTEPGEGTFIHEEGERVPLTASPASGYRFSHWSGDATGTSSTATVTMDRDRNVTANFERITYKLTTSVSPSGSGSVTPSSETYGAGTRVTLTASPASGYRFSHWSGDVTGTSTTTTVIMDRDRNVTATFLDVENDEPSITISPSAGVPGTTVTVLGDNFAPNAKVDIYFAGIWTAEVTAIGGTFTAIIKVPNIFKGFHTIRAEENATRYADSSFTVQSGLTVTPEKGQVGDSVTVIGRGFGMNETGIQLFFGIHGVLEDLIIQADPLGFWHVTFVIPPAVSGTHRIDTTPAATRHATFTVGPGIRLDRSSGSPGESVTVTGDGFSANERNISIFFEDVAVVTELRADDKGSWVETFEVPEMPTGTYDITAEGDRTLRPDVGSLSFRVE